MHRYDHFYLAVIQPNILFEQASQIKHGILSQFNIEIIAGNIFLYALCKKRVSSKFK